MNFQELRSALQVTGGQLTISHDTLSSAIRDFLRGYYKNEPIVITGASSTLASSAEDGDDIVVVSGKSSFLEMPDLPVTARFSLTARGAVTIYLEYELIGEMRGPNPWKFSRSLPGLPPVWNYELAMPLWPVKPDEGPDPAEVPQIPYVDSLALSNARYVVSTHATTDSASGAAIAKGINFVGDLRPTGALGILQHTLRPSPGGLTLSGTIVLPKVTKRTRPLALFERPWSRPDAPGLHLQAPLDLDVDLGKLVLDQTALRIYSPPSSDWMGKNNTFAPKHGYAARLAIPSADIEIDLSADLEWNLPRARLSAHCEGVSLKKLTELADLAGSGSLTSSLPKSIQKAVNGLGKLELTYVALDLVLAGAKPVLEGVFDRDRVAGPGVESLGRQNTSHRHGVPIRYQESIRHWRGQAVGRGHGHGHRDHRGRGHRHHGAQRQRFYALRQAGRRRDHPAEETFEEVRPQSSGSCRSHGRQPAPHGRPGEILFDGLHRYGKTQAVDDSGRQVQTDHQRCAAQLFLCQGNRRQGNIRRHRYLRQELRPVDGLRYSGRYRFAQYSLRYVAVADGRRAGRQKSVLPSKFDIDFDSASVLVQKKGQSYVFQVGAQLKDIGSFAFEVRKVTDGWGFAAGMSLRTSLSELPGLGALSGFEKSFRLQRLLLVASSFDASSFQFPDMAQFNTPGISGKDNISLPAQSGGLTAGMCIFADWKIDLKNKQQKMLKQFLGLPSSLGVALQVGKDPAKQSKLIVNFTTKVSGNPLVCQFGAMMQSGQPALFLNGQMTVKINKKPVIFDLTMLLVSSGMFLSGTMTGTVQFGTVKLSNLALMTAVSLERYTQPGNRRHDQCIDIQ